MSRYSITCVAAVVFLSTVPFLACGIGITRPPATQATFMQHNFPLVATEADEARALRNAQKFMTTFFATKDFGNELKDEQPADADTDGAKQRMINAASRESKGTKAAEAAASKFIDATLAKVDQILAGAENDVEMISTQASSDVTTGTARIEELARTELERDTKLQLDVRRAAEIAAQKLQTASKQEDMIQAASASMAATKQAAGTAGKIKDSLADTIKNMTLTKNSVVSSSRDATQSIKRLTAQAKADAEALGVQLQKFAASAASQLHAKSSADAIVSAATSTAQGIHDNVTEFVSKVATRVLSLSNAGDEKKQRIDDQIRTLEDKGGALVSTLSDGANEAGKALDEAKTIWMKAVMQAATQVDQAAGKKSAVSASTTAASPPSVEATTQQVSPLASVTSSHLAVIALSAGACITLAVAWCLRHSPK